MEASSILPNDPRASYLAHRAKIDAAISSCLSRGIYILGEEVRLFEEEFAAYLGVAQVVGVANGTDAIELALRACGIGPGHVVLTPANTVSATAVAIMATGAAPYFVDVDPKTFTIDCARLEKIVETSPRKFHAILPVHLYGAPCDLDALTSIATRYNLKLIEDCAQAHGSAWNGKKTGAWGAAAAFSFYPTKNLGCLGDGGAVATNNVELAQSIRELRQYGWQTRYQSRLYGRNSRLDEVQATILRVKLHFLETENNLRRQNAALYNTGLKRLPFTLPSQSDAAFSVYHQYTICVPNRTALEEKLSKEHIGFGTLYSTPLHKQPAFQKLERDPNLAVTERLANEVLNLPIHPYLNERQLQKVIQVLKQSSS